MKPEDVELRSSEEWSEITGITVIDPDGWDRRNFAASWSERITREEFERRAFASTIQMPAF